MPYRKPIIPTVESGLCNFCGERRLVVLSEHRSTVAICGSCAAWARSGFDALENEMLRSPPPRAKRGKP